MQRLDPSQLSFDAMPKRERREHEAPLTANISVGGGFDFAGIRDEDGLVPQLDHGEIVQVVVTDMDGQVIAHGHGKVQIGFKDKVVEEVPVTIREQKVKLL